MRFLFLNQYFPPDQAPTGLLLSEVASHLAAEEHDTILVSAGAEYRGSKRSGSRLLQELGALARILLHALRQKRPDVIVSGSSPPMLAFAGALLAAWRRAPHVHWAMDLYPELAVALGEIPEGPLSRLLTAAMGWAYRGARSVVVLDEDMAARLARYGVRAKIIRPWVTERIRAARSRAEAEAFVRGTDVWTWIYSGNLGRAHEWNTLLEAQSLVETRTSGIRLVFQGGGRSWPAARARAEELGLQRCEWLPYAPEAELVSSLLACDAVIATQRPEAAGLLWPSKLSLLMTLPRPIIWIGSKEGAIARMLRAIPSAGVFSPGEAGSLADYLVAQAAGGTDPAAAVPLTMDAETERACALAEWGRLLRSE